jgi:hypothetical protein
MLPGVLKSPIAVPGKGIVVNFTKGQSLGFIGKFPGLIEGLKIGPVSLFCET